MITRSEAAPTVAGGLQEMGHYAALRGRAATVAHRGPGREVPTTRREAPAAALRARLDAIEARATERLARHGILLLRVGLGLVFFWFGVLKFFPEASPAQDLAGRTLDVLTFGLIPPALGVRLLAAAETLIGIGLISGACLRAALLALLLQMLGTLTPLVLFPALTFAQAPYAPTMEGQYILKNIVLIAAALVIGATVRGGRLVAHPPAIGIPPSPEGGTGLGSAGGSGHGPAALVSRQDRHSHTQGCG